MRNLLVFLAFFFTLVVAVVIGGSRGPSPQPTADTAADRAAGVPHVGRVQILNGCGIDGLGWEVAEKLRKGGFDVKNDGIENAPTFNYAFSLVASRTADMRVAREVGRALGLDKDRVILMRDGQDRFDVTVIVGPDLEGRVP